MSKIGLIIKREYSTRANKRSFLLITILVPLILSVLVFTAMWFSIQETKQIKVLVSDPGNLCDGKVFVDDESNAPAIFYFLESDIDLDDFQYSEKYQQYDLLLGVQPEVITNKGIKGFYREKITARAEYYVRDRIELRLEEYFAMDRGITLSEYRRIRQEFNFKMSNIDPDKQDTTYAQGVGLVFSIFIFLFILIYASRVMRGVIEEKTSRVVEILVSSVKPIQLMMGKIIGIGLVGLTQFIIWIVFMGLSLWLMRLFIFQDMLNPANIADAIGPLNNLGGEVLTGQSPIISRDSELIDVIYYGVPWATLITLFIVYFTGGYLLYAALYAVVGAAVDSESDSQQAALPVTLILLFFFVLGGFVIANPAGGTGVWFSQIPFSSPLIMLQRVAAGTVHYTELIISISLLALTIFVLLKGAAKVYRTGILMYGKKASWKEIFKWLKY